MRHMLESPWRAATLGLVLTLGVIALPLAYQLDATSAFAVVIRALHLLGAMVWAGLIVFVNFVQLQALKAVSDTERPLIVRYIAGPTARLFTGAAHATLATGVLMLVPIGAQVHQRSVLLFAVAGGIAMWAIVQFILRPNVARITGKVAASDAEKATARVAIAKWARINLILVIPVSVAMLVAAHAGL